MSTNVANWDKYDTILIGYPIWWEIFAWSVNTFVKSNKADNYKLSAFNIYK